MRFLNLDPKTTVSRRMCCAMLQIGLGPFVLTLGRHCPNRNDDFCYHTCKRFFTISVTCLHEHVLETCACAREAAWHHPDISASYAFVIVKLQNHAAKGITDKDFLLAKKIEDVIQWDPGKDDNTLEGTPDDPRFKYIKYD